MSYQEHVCKWIPLGKVGPLELRICSGGGNCAKILFVVSAQDRMRAEAKFTADAAKKAAEWLREDARQSRKPRRRSRAKRVTKKS